MRCAVRRDPVFLGGDHSLSMGSVNGVARHWHAQGRELFVLWLDAHADYNTPATTITGNMHGMSGAFLCGEPGLDGLLPRTGARRSSRASLACSACARWTRGKELLAQRVSGSRTCGGSTSSASAC
jgi:arginase